jgi:hypothetical protein
MPRPGKRFVVYLSSLDNIELALSTGDCRHNTQKHWAIYEEIGKPYAQWTEKSDILAENDPRLLAYISDPQTIRECLEEAKSIAVSSYRQVLEDGPDQLMPEGEKEELCRSRIVINLLHS